jgi:hypothetical protein
VGQLAEALKQWRRLTKLHPQLIIGWLKVGGIAIAGSKFKEAIEAGKLDQWSVKVAKADDGSTDFVGTLENVADRYKELVDPAERAAFASARPFACLRRRVSSATSSGTPPPPLLSEAEKLKAAMAVRAAALKTLLRLSMRSDNMLYSCHCSSAAHLHRFCLRPLNSRINGSNG